MSEYEEKFNESIVRLVEATTNLTDITSMIMRELKTTHEDEIKLEARVLGLELRTKELERMIKCDCPTCKNSRVNIEAHV